MYLFKWEQDFRPHRKLFWTNVFTYDFSVFSCLKLLNHTLHKKMCSHFFQFVICRKYRFTYITKKWCLSSAYSLMTFQVELWLKDDPHITKLFTWPLIIWPSQVGDQISAELVICLHCAFWEQHNLIYCLW